MDVNDTFCVVVALLNCIPFDQGLVYKKETVYEELGTRKRQMNTSFRNIVPQVEYISYHMRWTADERAQSKLVKNNTPLHIHVTYNNHVTKDH